MQDCGMNRATREAGRSNDKAVIYDGIVRDCPYKTRVVALRRGYPLFALAGTAFVMYS